MIQTLDIIYQLCLFGDIIKIYLIVGRIGQRIVILESICCIFISKIFLFIILPRLVCRLIIHSGNFRSGLNGSADRLDLFLCSSLIKEYRNWHFFFYFMCYGIYVVNNGIENSYQKDACSHCNDTCQGKHPVSFYILKSLLQGIPDRTRPHDILPLSHR